MTVLLEKDLDGTLITDELIICDEPHVIDGTTYYRGYVSNVGDASIIGTSSSTVCVYPGPSKTGTRQNVIFNGVPTSNELMIDYINGIVLSPIASIFYMTYYAYEPLRHNSSNKSICVFYYPTTLNETVYVPYYSQYYYWSITVDGYVPSGNVVLTAYNDYQSGIITILSGQTSSTGNFTSILKTTNENPLIISGATSGMAGFNINLWQV